MHGPEIGVLSFVIYLFRFHLCAFIQSNNNNNILLASVDH